MVVININIILRFCLVGVLDFVAIVLLSFGMYWAFVELSDVLTSFFYDMQNAKDFTYNSPNFYLIVLLTSSVAFFGDFVIRFANYVFWPNPNSHLIKLVRENKVISSK